MKKLKKVMKLFVTALLVLAFSIFGVNLYVWKVGESFLVEVPKKADAVIVPGASVYGNRVSEIVAKRLNTAYEIYQNGYTEKIIVSGDHGKNDYNEVKAMKTYLLGLGVPETDIFMDHAGFSTYDTIYRAKEVFMVEKAIIVSQKEHLVRALYIAESLELDACGVSAGKYSGEVQKSQTIREIFARVKAFLQCEILRGEPTFLGEPIPVSQNDGRVTEG